MLNEHALRPLRDAWRRIYRRIPTPKPGGLVAMWGHRREDGPDIYFCRGNGVPKPDGHLLNMFLCSPRMRHAHSYDSQQDRHYGYVWDKSLVEELIARGYDITTLRFSIQKKPVEAPT